MKPTAPGFRFWVAAVVWCTCALLCARASPDGANTDGIQAALSALNAVVLNPSDHSTPVSADAIVVESLGAGPVPAGLNRLRESMQKNGEQSTHGIEDEQQEGQQGPEQEGQEGRWPPPTTTTLRSPATTTLRSPPAATTTLRSPPPGRLAAASPCPQAAVVALVTATTWQEGQER